MLNFLNCFWKENRSSSIKLGFTLFFTTVKHLVTENNISLRNLWRMLKHRMYPQCKALDFDAKSVIATRNKRWKSRLETSEREPLRRKRRQVKGELHSVRKSDILTPRVSPHSLRGSAEYPSHDTWGVSRGFTLLQIDVWKNIILPRGVAFNGVSLAHRYEIRAPFTKRPRFLQTT